MLGVKTKLSVFFTNIYMYNTLHTVSFDHKDPRYILGVRQKCTVCNGTVNQQAPQGHAMEESVLRAPRFCHPITAITIQEA